MQKAAPEISEIKVAEGIYFSDYRQTLTSPSNNCLQVAINQNSFLQKDYKAPNNLEILLADYKEFANRIKNLDFSNEEIQKEENWELDPDFSSAILENIPIILKLLGYQSLCLSAIAALDPLNSFLKENLKETIDNNIIRFEQQKITIENLLAAASKNKEEGILL